MPDSADTKVNPLLLTLPRIDVLFSVKLRIDAIPLQYRGPFDRRKLRQRHSLVTASKTTFTGASISGSARADEGPGATVR
jgi:hypothetical protein